MKLKKIIKNIVKQTLLEYLATDPNDPESPLNFEKIKQEAFKNYEESGDKKRDEKTYAEKIAKSVKQIKEKPVSQDAIQAQTTETTP